MEIVLALIGSILMLGAVCYLGSLFCSRTQKNSICISAYLKDLIYQDLFFDRDKTQED